MGYRELPKTRRLHRITDMKKPGFPGFFMRVA
jgi:hypothetical protein